VLPVDAQPELFFNPSCSKCVTAASLLEKRGIDARQVRYLEQAPTIEDLQVLMRRLAIDDPREMMRTGEDLFAQLELDGASADRLLAALVAHPILLERPIFVLGDRAVIARPPERLLELL
jgi:arsenate reductase